MFYHVEVGWLPLEDQGVVSKNDNLPPFCDVCVLSPFEYQGDHFLKGISMRKYFYGSQP